MKIAKIDPLLQGFQNNLSSDASTIFEKALRERKISTQQILELIHPKYRKGSKLADAMDFLTNVFTSQKILVFYTLSKKETIDKILKRSEEKTPVIHLNVDEQIVKKKEEESLEIGQMEEDFELVFQNSSKMFAPDVLREVDWYSTIASKHKLLSKETTYELIEKAQKGSIEARNILVAHNQKLVLFAVRRHFKIVLLQTGAIEMNDMYQEGMIGLCKAIEKFDVSLGLSLTTYAYWWIHQAITRGLSDLALNIRIPVHIHEKLAKYRKIYAFLEIRAEQKPNILDIAEELNISPKQVYELEALNQTKGTISFDEPFDGDDSDDGDGMNFESILSDKGMWPEKNVDRKILKERIRKSMKKNLSIKEFQIIEKRFGLGDIKPLKLEEIGQEFGVTRERIRQIESIALKKICSDNEIRCYASEYLDLEIPLIPGEAPIEKPEQKMEKVNDWRVLKSHIDYSLVSRVLNIVSKYYAVPIDRILSDAKKDEYVHAREISIHILINHCKVRFTEIERKFKMENATVRAIYNKMLTKIRREISTEREVEFIIELLSMKS